MDIAIVIYEGFTGLDAIGPCEVLARLPHARVQFVAPKPGECRADVPGLEVVAGPLSAMPHPDVVVVAGGSRTHDHLDDDRLLDWLREADSGSDWTTSVCTGALLLGAAGLLEGRRATTHWYELDSLRCFGAVPVAERVVEDGSIITAAGVSAGIDMALLLSECIEGSTHVQMAQLNLEYDPQPRYQAGSIAKAPADIVEAVTSTMRRLYGPPWIERAQAER